MVPDLIWSLNFLVPEKFWPQEIWYQQENYYFAFSCRDQIGGPFSGTKFLWTKMKLGTKIYKGIKTNFLMPQFTGMHLGLYASTNLF